MTELTKSAYVVLGLISKRPQAGYDIKQIMRKIARYIWSESNAQIYPILKKLEQNKLVTSQLDKTSGARRRCIYTITKKGMEQLKDWLNEPSDPTPYREEVLLKLSLGQHLSKKQLQKILENYKEKLEEQLKEEKEIIKHIETEHEKRPDKPYLLLVYNQIEKILETKIAWCKKILNHLP